MLRLSLAWRITLVLILALIALQIVSSVVYFVQRDATTASGFRAPLPDQVAALAILMDKPAGEEAQLLLRALNGPSLSVSIVDEPVPIQIEARRLAWLERAIRRNLPQGDARAVLVSSDGASTGDASIRRRWGGLFARDPVEIIIGLSGERSLHVRPTDGLSVRLFGLPAGFIASLLGFAIALLAGFAILRETRPLARLAVAVERFGQGMEAEALPETGAPEMRALVRAFNGMQARIAGLVHGRTFVVAAIAHDLRTHLTRLRLRVAMISEDRIRERAERDVEDMQALVEEALFYAKATRSRDDRTMFDLALLVDEVCLPRAELGASAAFARPQDPIFLSASRLSIGRAIGNLVDNAILYGGSAELSIECREGEVAVWVDDRGPGIPERERERILEPFERLETSRGRDTGGTGLGLAIVREIVDAHGGRVVIQNRPGGGSRFGLVLPRSPPVG
ncbi:ATP-binding protein [Kaistia algarum]|uniref:ATP-binding protein n=1 Tax=Kaistia algarum TaxID=2083279 RepID=UPI00225BD77D|nr:ATP-binding protein [Kaistia algarum]MCX5514111.1 ATP-binding protein [Kaistia algarum]